LIFWKAMLAFKYPASIVDVRHSENTQNFVLIHVIIL